MNNTYNNKILLVGKTQNINSLESFYANAFKNEGFEVSNFDFNKQKKIISYKRRLQLFIKSFFDFNFDLLVQEVNHDLIINIKNICPNVVIVFTNTPVLFNTLLYIKTAFPKMKLIYYWADSVINLQKEIFFSAKFYDLLAIHSNSLTNQFQNFGFAKCIWVPFAVDDIHISYNVIKKFDIGFLGGHSYERETVLLNIIEHFPELKIGISGVGWKKSKSNLIRNRVVGESLVGTSYSDFLSSCFISINIISSFSYPSTNMRFFEILSSGSIQLTTFSPEHVNSFKEGIDLFYFENNKVLIEKINVILSLSKNEIDLILDNARKKVLSSSTYRHRVRQIISNI